MSSRRLIANLFLIAVFFIFWVIPVLAQGLFRWRSPWVPRDVFYFQRTSGLFVNRVAAWRVYYIQVQRLDSSTWASLSEESLFPKQPFGWRSRFQRYLNEYSEEPVKTALQRELADWIQGRDRSITAVRFLVAEFPTNRGALFKGHWENPKFADILPSQTTTMATYYFPAQ